MKLELKKFFEDLIGAHNAPDVRTKPSAIFDLAVQKTRELGRGVLDILDEKDIGMPSYREDAVLAQERFEPTEWVRPLDNQLETLLGYMPTLKVEEPYFRARREAAPVEGTNRVLVPKISALGKANKLENSYAQIGVLVEQVCSFLDTQREGQFTHYRKGALGPDRIRCIQQIVDIRKKLEAATPGDLLVLDADMGNRYAGWTPRRARSHTLISAKELALSSVDVAWVLLLNPDRLQRNTDLSVDAVMEEYLSLDRGWVTNLFFYHRGGKLEFGYRWNRRAYFDCGSAVAEIKQV